MLLIILLIGIVILFKALSKEEPQNWRVILGAIGIIFSISLIFLFKLFKEPEKNLKYIISSVIFFFVVVLLYLNIRSIMEPIEFQKEKAQRYSAIIERLKIIRKIQLAYREKYGRYASEWDTLINFVKFDSIRIIKKTGFVPDTLTEEEALKRKLISRETLYVKVLSELFSTQKDTNMPTINIDSIKFVPFSTNKTFILRTAEINRNNIIIPVFEVLDPAPFDPTDTLKLGSLTEPSTSGNWE